jgi:hypothetical protein
LAALRSATMSTRSVAVRRRLLVVPTIDGLWALVAVAIPTAGAFAGRMMAIDLAYQIRAGAVMLQTHRVLDVDMFTFTVRGQPWVNQQWGAEVLLAAIYHVGGWAGVAVMRGVLLGLVQVTLYRTCRAAGAAARTAALLTIAGWLVGIEILPAMRPQLFACLIFAVVLWIVTTRHESPTRIFWVPLLVVLWANLHGSFPLVLVLLGIAWLEDHREDPVFARRLLLVGGTSVLASLANPFGMQIWAYALNLSSDPVVVRQIAEWGPPSVQTLTGFIFFASVFSVATLLARRSGDISWVSLLTLGLFAGVGLIAIRGVVWWAIVAPVVVANLVSDAERRRDATRPKLHLLLAAAIVIVVLVTLPIARDRDAATGGPAVLTYAPEALVSAAQGVSQPGAHAFVSQLYASWSEFSAPSLPVAVDPRIEIFPVSVWDDYFIVSSGRDGWDDVLDRWRVRVLILEPGQARGLLEVLPRHPEWRLIAEDASGAVYARA